MIKRLILLLAMAIMTAATGQAGLVPHAANDPNFVSLGTRGGY
jgi:hypothetical protein